MARARADKPDAVADGAPKRTRKNKIEMPGDPSGTSAPITKAAVNGVLQEQQAAAQLQDHEQPLIEVQDAISIAREEGNVHRHQPPQYNYGDTWAGMVLTPDGWVHPSQLPAPADGDQDDNDDSEQE